MRRLQPAQRVALVRVGVHAPVELLKVFVDRGFDVHPALAGVADLRAGFAVDDVGAQRREAVRVVERVLDGVLHFFDVKRALLRARETGHDERLDDVPGARLVEFARGLAGARDGAHDLLNVEFLDGAVALQKVARRGGGSRSHMWWSRLSFY